MTLRNGFSRPEWPVILRALRDFNSPPSKAAAWADVIAQWLKRWKTELGEGFEVVQSSSCSLLSKLDGDVPERLLQKANWMISTLRRAAGPVAWEGCPHLVFVHIEEADRAQQFCDALKADEPASFVQTAAFPLAPAWMLLQEPLEAQCRREIENSLVWSCFDHLPLPYWLARGVRTQLEHALAGARMEQAPALQNPSLIPNHRRFWFEDTIQTLWAGTTPREYPEYQDLYIELCDLFVYFLSERTPSLSDFLRLASNLDGGQTAARILLKIDLGDIAATFLGPGQWTPDPLAIADCWERVEQITSDHAAS